jgi:hypothetical protein
VIQFRCPQCQSKLKVHTELAGRRGKCPKCGALLSVPSSAQIEDTKLEPTEPERTPPQHEALPSPPTPPKAQQAQSPSHPSHPLPGIARGPALGALASSVILGISVPMKWEEIYASGMGESISIGTTGWIILIDVVFIAVLAIAQLGATTNEQARQLAKAISFFAGCAFLYAAYTLFIATSVFSSDTSGFTSGIRSGPGAWIGIVGGLVGLLSQLRFCPKQLNSVNEE